MAGSREFFSDTCMTEMENYFPVTYSYYDSMKRNMFDVKDVKAEERYLKILDAVISY
jgi:hypothetical protein